MRIRGCILLFLCFLLGGVSCQKVELPLEKEDDGGLQTERPGGDDNSSEDGGGENGEPGDEEDSGVIVAYSVSKIQKQFAGVDLEEDYEKAVVGYIVGSCIGTSYGSATFKAEGASKSNFLIADSPEETDKDKCMPVELGTQDGLRYELNLADHPEHLGRKIYLYGLVKKYFRVIGLKNVEVYEWAEEDTEEPDTPSEPEFPEEPSEPETPSEPEEPSEPETPSEPDVPEEPDIPTEPETPEEEKNDTIKIEQNPMEPVPGGRTIEKMNRV